MDHAACTCSAVQKQKPARKTPSRCDEPRRWQSGTRLIARPSTAPSSTYGCCCSGMRCMAALMRPGITRTASPPKTSIRPSETAIGVSIATGVGLVSA